MRRLFIFLFHLAWTQIVLAQTGIANQNFGKDTLQLREVVVRATRPLAKLNSEGFVTEVKGTVLEKLGFAKDVMGMLPGSFTGRSDPYFFVLLVKTTWPCSRR